MDLDHNVWAHLPDVLVRTILRFLSSESIFKFRSVSKTWHEILTNPSFLKERLGAPHSTPFCVLLDNVHMRFAVYNVATELWYYPPYEGLLSVGCFTSNISIERITVRAAAAGLLLLEVLPERRRWAGQDDVLERESDNTKPLLLVNPVNKSYRKLPDLEGVRYLKVVGIDLDAETGTIQVLARSTLFGRGVARSQFHVYDFEINSWEMVYDSRSVEGPEEWDKTYRVLEPAILHRGYWYYLTYAHRFWGPRMGSVTPHVFRIKRGVAETVRAPLPQENGMIIHFLHLFLCNGKLVLAGSVKSSCNLILNEWMSFRFWELDDHGLEWVEYVRMPHYLVSYLGNRSVKRFALDLECSVDGDHICFWVGRPAGRHYRTLEIIMYSISMDSWWTVNSGVEMPRIACESPHVYGGGLGIKAFAYFMFRPNVNITL